MEINHIENEWIHFAQNLLQCRFMNYVAFTRANITPVSSTYHRARQGYWDPVRGLRLSTKETDFEKRSCRYALFSLLFLRAICRSDALRSRQRLMSYLAKFSCSMKFRSVRSCLGEVMFSAGHVATSRSSGLA